MAQHFRLTPAARDFGVLDLAGITPDEADKMVQDAHWGSTLQQTCPECGTYDKHYKRRQRKGCRRPCSPANPDPDLPPSSPSAASPLKAGQPQWECKSCTKRFTATTNTIFHLGKLSNWQIVAAITLVLGGANGMASLELSSHLGLHPTSAFLFLHRLREVMAENLDESMFSGLVQMDGGYYCGKPYKPNRKFHPTKQQLANRFGSNKKIEKSEKPWLAMGMTEGNYYKRQNKRVVMVITQSGQGVGNGSSRVQVVVAYGETENVVRALAKKYILPGTEIHTDECGAYTNLSAHYILLTVRHKDEFCDARGVNDNHAEAFFSRLRRAEYGIYHGMRNIHLFFYAAEAAWRHNHRNMPKSLAVLKLLKLCMAAGPSKSFRGYHQGKGRKNEILFDIPM